MQISSLWGLIAMRNSNEHTRFWHIPDWWCWNKGLQTYSELSSNILMEQHRQKIANSTCQSKWNMSLKEQGLIQRGILVLSPPKSSVVSWLHSCSWLSCLRFHWFLSIFLFINPQMWRVDDARGMETGIIIIRNASQIFASGGTLEGYMP